MERKTLTRKELYNLVWQKPTRQLAKDFGVSDSAIAKWCKRMEVPKPPRGYWAQAQADKKNLQKPLKPLSRKGIEKIDIHHSPDAAKVKKIEVPNKNITVVPGSSRSRHDLIRKAKEVYRIRKPDDYGMIASQGDSVLDMRVSPDNLERALLFYDTLIKTLEKMGHEVVIGDRWNQPVTVVKFLESDIHVRIYEKSNRSQNKSPKSDFEWGYNKYVYTPSGLLAFEIQNSRWDMRKRWSDSGRKKFEEALPDIINSFYKFNELKKFDDIEKAKARRIRELEMLEIERRKQEQRKEAFLQDLAVKWDNIGKINRFLDAIAQTYPDDADILDYVKWGRHFIRRVDPVKNIAQYLHWSEKSPTNKP